MLGMVDNWGRHKTPPPSPRTAEQQLRDGLAVDPRLVAEPRNPAASPAGGHTPGAKQRVARCVARFCGDLLRGPCRLCAGVSFALPSRAALGAVIGGAPAGCALGGTRGGSEVSRHQRRNGLTPVPLDSGPPMTATSDKGSASRSDLESMKAPNPSERHRALRPTGSAHGKRTRSLAASALFSDGGRRF